jgi:hypothetical protein
MSVGIVVTKLELDARAGGIARGFQRGFDDVAVLKGFLDATVDADLVTLGYEPNEIATLKTAWADLAQLGTIWAGFAALPIEKDFRTFVRRLWGVGAF